MKLYLVHMSSIIMLISCMSIPGITICPSLAPRSSLSMGTVHSFSVGISKYFKLFTFLELREPLEILHSLAIFDTDLPTRVLLSSNTKLAKYLTPPLLLVLRDSMNLIIRQVSKVLGWLVQERGVIRYRWVVYGTLKTFLMVTFQEE